MRISTSSIFEVGGSKLSELSSSVYRTQQQLAAGRKILSPEDDPIGAARALVLAQSDAINTQFATNRANAKSNLQVTDGVLGNVTDVYHNVKSLLVQAGNGTLSNSDRGFIAAELQGNLDQLLSLANSTDGTGTYIFSGYSTTTQPFQKTLEGANYLGDQGQRYIQVDTSRNIPLSPAGLNVFGGIRTSNNSFTVTPSTSNVGKGSVSIQIDDPTKLTNQNYSIEFQSLTSFSVKNTTTGATLGSYTYTSPSTTQALVADGISITLSDSGSQHAIGDKFSVQQGNQNIFQTITDVINTLKTPLTTSIAKTEFAANLKQSIQNVDNSLDNVLTARASVGINLKEIESLDDEGSAKSLSIKSDISAIVDLDYAEAISKLTFQTTTLQAAQQSFMKLSNLSLFDYLR